MKARLRKEKDVYLFDLEGHLDLRGMDRLKSLCSHESLKKKKIVFNLKSLFFVASTGVAVLSETLDFMNKNSDLKICCASSEFEKIFSNEGLESTLCSSEAEALSSFDKPAPIEESCFLDKPAGFDEQAPFEESPSFDKSSFEEQS